MKTITEVISETASRLRPLIEALVRQHSGVYLARDPGSGLVFIDGLDCAHTGLCYRDDQGRERLLHASTTAREVTLDDELAAYLARVSTHTGIIVARPLEPARPTSSHR